MAPEIIAREAELATVLGLLSGAGRGPRALVIEGAPGIGKSTLWSAGLAVARERLPHVLVSRPAETERSLANVVLGDLFGDLPPAVLATMPTPRRRALESALLVGESDDAAIDPRALGAAVLTSLAALAAQGPLLIAIDDDQWADSSSIARLRFALRRLREAAVTLLLARRVEFEHDGPASSVPPPEGRLESSLEPDAVEHLRVGPLSVGAIQALLQTRLGVTLSRPNLIRLGEASGGNPFFALALAAAQPPVSGASDALVVPPTLERLLTQRLDQLDDESRTALLLIAAHGRAPLGLLRRLDLGPPRLERATSAGLIESSGDVVRFAHPLLASTVYQRASAAQRRDAHLRLSGAVEDPISRARHKALATNEPDEHTAAELEAVGAVARTRGLPLVAAELAEHATRLTRPGQVEPAARRRAVAARAFIEAGEPKRARAIVETLLADAPLGRRRAEALVLASELEEPGPAVALLGQALREARGAPELRAAIHARLAESGRFLNGRGWAERHARAAVRLADRLGDRPLQAGALAILAALRFEDADPNSLDMAREAHGRAVAVGDPGAIRVATWGIGHQLMWLRRHDEAREWLEVALGDAAKHDELLRASCLWSLAMNELWAGRWGIAWAHAEEAAEIHRQYGIEQPQDHMPQALIALHRGDLALARRHSTRALSVAEGMMLPTHTAILGMAELWSGRPGEAIDSLARAEQLTRQRGVREPSLRVGWGEYVEALLQLGQVAAAQEACEEWTEAATRGGRAWALADAVRATGLIAAARGQLERAAERLDEAARRHEQLGDPFDRARALLALGAVRRRQRRKQLARIALEAACAEFEMLGATGFADASRRELARLGGRRRIEGLSPSERRVAQLVAEGQTNREVAASLFLGERTVASHLTHIYAKLGVRSRTELASRLSQPGGDSTGSRAPASNIPTF